MITESSNTELDVDICELWLNASPSNAVAPGTDELLPALFIDLDSFALSEIRKSSNAPVWELGFKQNSASPQNIRKNGNEAVEALVNQLTDHLRDQSGFGMLAKFAPSVQEIQEIRVANIDERKACSRYSS